jgi:hypothetical protein
MHLNFNIKYHQMHEIIRAGFEEAGVGAVKNRSQSGRSRDIL